MENRIGKAIRKTGEVNIEIEIRLDAPDLTSGVR